MVSNTDQPTIQPALAPHPGSVDSDVQDIVGSGVESAQDSDVDDSSRTSEDRFERNTTTCTSSSRDATPTPEPSVNNLDSRLVHPSDPKEHSHMVTPTPQEPDSLLSLHSSRQPITEPLEDTTSGLTQRTPALSSPHGSALSFPRPSRLDSDVETSSVVSVQQLTDMYLNDPFDSAEENLTVGTNTTSTPVALPASVDSERRSKTPIPLDGQNLLPTKVVPEGSSGRPKTVHHSQAASVSRNTTVPAHVQSTTSKKIRSLSPGSQSSSPSHNSQTVSKDVSPSVNSRSLVASNGGPEDKVCREDHLQSGMGRGTDHVHSEVNEGTQDETAGDQLQTLKDQLHKSLQAKANLEGQLGSVVDECKNTLKERANLHAQLGKAEAQLVELSEALEKEKRKSDAIQSGTSFRLPSTPQEDEMEQLKQALEDTKDTLNDQIKGNSALKGELAREKQNSQSLRGELEDFQKASNDLEQSLLSTQDKYKALHGELDKKKGEAEEAQCKASSLEASYAALEDTKGWLHQQLQDSLEAKMKLQEELRDAKAAGITQCIKAEQLMKENAAFQKQVSNLQKGVLQDKARLVSELEAIEADVLFREDSYGHIVAEKGQLQDIVKMKSDVLDSLNSKLAQAQVAIEELEKKAEDLEMNNDTLVHRVKDIERGKKSLEGKLHRTEQDLENKSSLLEEMDKLKASLQERVRGSEAGLVGRDGTIQGLHDAHDIIKQELEMTKQAKDVITQELHDAKLEVAQLEDELKAAMDENSEAEARLNAITQNQQSLAAKNEVISSQLTDKEKELREKIKELQAVESQSDDFLDQFKNLQDQFQTMVSQNSDVGNDVAEKDQVISHLASERDNMEEDLTSLRQSNEELQSRLTQLQQEKAHLEGLMESSPSKDLQEFQKSVQDKSQLQAELNSLKMSHQHDLIKAQAKGSHLESELRASKRELDKTEKELEKALRRHEDVVAKLEEENACLLSDVKTVKQKLDDLAKANTGTKYQASALRQVEREKDRLQAKVEQLSTENRELDKQLENEITQKAEIERAGSVVVKNLKQNAKQSETKLQEQMQEMSLQVEKLRGQLVGKELTLSAMREHVEGLEAALSKREAALVKLSARAQKVLEEKELEDQEFSAKMKSLEKQLEQSKMQSRIVKEKASEERKKVVELTRELSNRDEELTDLRVAMEQSSQRINDAASLDDRVRELAVENETLQTEVARMNTQLTMVKAVTSSAVRELSDKEALLELVKQELTLAKAREEQAVGESRQARDQLKEVRERHASQVSGLQRALSEAERLRQDSSAVADVPTGLFNSSLSTIGMDETDRPSSGEPCTCMQVNVRM